jgi:DNA repair exonuclease SbcCD ATPase subunit
VAPNRNRFTVDNVVVLKRNELLSSVSAGLASIDTGEDEAVVEKNTVAKRKTAEEERRIYHQEREEKRLERVMMEKEKLAQQVQEMRAARKAEAARKAACEEKQALDSLFEDDEPEHEAITPEQLKFEAELEAAIWTSFDEGEEGPSCPPKDEIKDAISTIPAQKRKFTSIVTTASIPTPTPIPASAKKEKKNKMPTQEALQRAIPAQGINLRELAKEFSIDGKDMSKAVKFEARVKMWFRKEGGAVFA